MMIDDTYALAIYTSRGASLKQKQCGFLCLFVCLFVWSLVCLCVLLFPLFVFLVSLFYDDRWYINRQRTNKYGEMCARSPMVFVLWCFRRSFCPTNWPRSIKISQNAIIEISARSPMYAQKTKNDWFFDIWIAEAVFFF